VGGVQPQSETVWRQANKYKVPRWPSSTRWTAGANFFKALTDEADRLKANPVPVVHPDRRRGQLQGRGRPAQDEGHHLGRRPRKGMKFEYHEIPAELVETANKWRENLVEAAAEASEDLMNKYLEEGYSVRRSVKAGLRARTMATANPAHAVRLRFQEQGCAAHAGRRDRLPAFAGGHAAVTGTDPENEETKRQPHADDGEKFAALAFKLMTDPFVGS
jgi:elongation factor G